MSCNKFGKAQESMACQILQHGLCLPQLPACALGILPCSAYTILLQNVILNTESFVTESFDYGEGSVNWSDGSLLERLGVHVRYVLCA
jgi:hypothetical protein